MEWKKPHNQRDLQLEAKQNNLLQTKWTRILERMKMKQE